MKSSSKTRWMAVALAIVLSGCSVVRPAGDGTAPGTTEGAGAPILAPALPDKGDPQARFSAALSLWKQNQIAETEEAFKALIADFPEFAGPWTNLGILYAKSNRRDQAIGALTKAVSLNPDNGIAYNWLGILYRESRDYPKASQAYQKALDIDPDHALAHYNLAILLDEHLKRPQDALPHYRAYQKLTGKEDLKVMAWVAEIEARNQPAAAGNSATKAQPTP
jgi:tetratricopeptide (TPR) repeat protein